MLHQGLGVGLAVSTPNKVAETLRAGLEVGKGYLVGHFPSGISASSGERNRHLDTRLLSRFHGGVSSQHDQVGQRDLDVVFSGIIELLLDALKLLNHPSGAGIDCPVLLRRQANASAIGPTALIGVAIG